MFNRATRELLKAYKENNMRWSYSARQLDEQQRGIEYLIETIDQMHEDATERAHAHPFDLIFDYGQVFTQEEIDSVYHQGKKDACRIILQYLKNI